MNKSSYYGEGSKLPGGIDLNGRYPLDYRELINSWDPHDEIYDIDTISFDSLYTGMRVSDSTGKVKVLETIPFGATTAHECTWKEIGKVTSVSAGVGLTTSDGNAITTAGTIKAKLKSETPVALDAALGDTAGRQYAVELDQGEYLSVNVPWKNDNTTYSFSQSGNNLTVTPSPSGTAFTYTPSFSGQVQSDWSQTVTTATDYIKNKPVIPSASSVTNYITVGGAGGGTDISVYMPAGTIIMTMRSSAPDGWLMCNGQTILAYTSDPEDNTYSVCYAAFIDRELNPKLLKIWIKKPFVDLIAHTSADGNGSLRYVGQLSIQQGQYLTTVDITRVQNYQNIALFTGKVNSITLNFLDFRQKFPLGAQPGSTIGKNGHDNDSPGYSTDLGSTGGEARNVLSEKEMPSHVHGIPARDSSGSGSNVTEYEEGGRSTTIDSDSKGDGDAHNNIPPFFAINFMIKY